MSIRRLIHILITGVVTLLLLFLQPQDCVAAQRSVRAAPAPPAIGPSDGESLGSPILPATGRSIRISLEEHRLYVLEGDDVVWSAKIGTGTGEILETEDQRWEFDTPRGQFHVQLKEKDPVWWLPDWVFIKRGDPLPARDSPDRKVEDALGAAALYLTREIAIHGTDEPELLGDQISHGCIRMSNEDVLRLYEEVEVGTPVIIQ